MNVSDSEIVRSVLLNDETRSYTEVDDEVDADVILTNTCAIRDGAEKKIWQRLRKLNSMNDRTSKNYVEKRGGRNRVVGVLGCMAERLKDKMFDEGNVDLIVGPDSYRDLPRLISTLYSPEPAETASNTQLSLEETYAEIHPVRTSTTSPTAFVSIMRGCNNMCSYCIVPFTRGRERSRNHETILEEIRRLAYDDVNPLREVILLGQNVNSYHDKGEDAKSKIPGSDYITSNEGFSNTFKSRGGAGYYFTDLVEEVSNISPEMRYNAERDL